MTDAIDTLLRAADKKSGGQPVAAICQPFSTTAADALLPHRARSEQPELAPTEKQMPVDSPKKPTDAKKDTVTLSAPMLPIPMERHLPSYKKPNAALTFPEKVRFPMVASKQESKQASKLRHRSTTHNGAGRKGKAKAEKHVFRVSYYDVEEHSAAVVSDAFLQRVAAGINVHLPKDMRPFCAVCGVDAKCKRRF